MTYEPGESVRIPVGEYGELLRLRVENEELRELLRYRKTDLTDRVLDSAQECVDTDDADIPVGNFHIAMHHLHQDVEAWRAERGEE